MRRPFTARRPPRLGPLLCLLGAVGCGAGTPSGDAGASAGNDDSGGRPATDASSGGSRRGDADTGGSSEGGRDAGADAGHVEARAPDAGADGGAWRAVDGGEPAVPADDFVDSVGVNVHLSAQGTPYYDGFAQFEPLLVGSGIRHLRDGFVTGDSTFASHVEELADAGVHADLITGPDVDAGFVAAFTESLHGAVDALEAPNEYNASADPNWAATLQGYLPVLQQAVGLPALAGMPVVGPSLTTEMAYGALGNVSTNVTVGNVHVYFFGVMPENPGWGGTDSFGTYGSIPYFLAIAAQSFGSLPDWMTELGIGTQPLTQGQVPLDVQGKYVPRALFESFRLGVPRTYLYQFMDQGSEGDGFGYFGLVAVDPTDLTGTTKPFTPKPAYVALTALLGELDDRGASFTPGSLALGIEGESASLHHVLLEKRDQTFVLAYWLAEPVWDPDLPTSSGPGGYVTVAPQTFSVAIGQPLSMARVVSFDGSTGAKGVAALDGSTGSLTLSATDTVQLLEVRP